MGRRNFIFWGILGGLLMLAAQVCWGVPSLINIQGKLTTPRRIETSDLLTINFYDGISHRFNTYSTPLATALDNNGIFNINIPLTDNLYTNFLMDSCSIEVSLPGVTFPLQKITSVPLAITARNVISTPANPGIVRAYSSAFSVYGITTGGDNVAGVGGTSLSYDGNGLWGNAPEGTGVYGTGGIAGVFGNSTTGYGVWGITTASNNATSVLGINSGETAGPFSAGITGLSTHLRGGPGIQGFSTSTQAPGIYGYANHHYGIVGKSEAPGFAGAAGISELANGTGIIGISDRAECGPAIYGTSESASAPAILARASRYHGIVGTSEIYSGVYGTTTSPRGFGVLGESYNPRGGPAVQGNSESLANAGVLGIAPYGHGVAGYSHRANYAGVVGLNDARDGIGVKGVSGGTREGIGILGTNETGGIGVYGSTIATGDQKSPFLAQTFIINSLPSGRTITHHFPLPDDFYIYGGSFAGYTTDDRVAIILPLNYALAQRSYGDGGFLGLGAEGISYWTDSKWIVATFDPAGQNFIIRNNSEVALKIRGIIFYGPEINTDGYHTIL